MLAMGDRAADFSFSGSFSIVSKAVDKRTGDCVAIKAIRKSELGDEKITENQIQTEVAIMKAVNHSHIVALREVHDFHGSIFMVMELYVRHFGRVILPHLAFASSSHILSLLCLI